jgi:hypothetical protein
MRNGEALTSVQAFSVNMENSVDQLCVGGNQMVRVNSFFSSAFARNSLDRLFGTLPNNGATKNVERLARQVSRDIPKAGGFESLDLRTSGIHRDAIAKIEKSIGIIRSALGYDAQASDEITYASGLKVTRRELHHKRYDEGVSSRFFLDVEGTQLADQLKIISTGPRQVGVDGNGGNDTISIIGKTAQSVYGGQGGDDINLIVEDVSAVHGQEGADRLTVMAKSAGFINGGMGNDTFNIFTDHVYSVHGDNRDGDGSDPVSSAVDALNGQNDTINIAARAVSGIYAGAGNDTLNITASNQLIDVDGGDGNDIISIVGNDVREINGGAGDDHIMINAKISEEIRGGKGDDFITLLGTEESSISFAKGDGRDLINISGVTTIVLEDGLRAEKATISREANAIKVFFAESNDTITLFHGYADFDAGGPGIEIVSDGIIRIG